MVTLVVMALASFPVLRLYARRVERSSADRIDKVHRLRRAFLVYALLWLVAVGLVALELQHAFDGVRHGLVPLFAVAGLVLFFASLVGAYLGIRPSYERLRGIEGAARRGPARLLRALVALSLPAMIWAGVFVVLLDQDVHPAALGAAIVGFLILVAVAAPVLVMAAVQTREPDPATTEKLERLCRQHGVQIRGVRIMDTRHDPAANAAFAGFGPGPKYVFVTDLLLEQFSEEELAAVMAHEIAHRKKHHILIKLGAHLGAVVGLGLLFAGLAFLSRGVAAESGVVLAIGLAVFPALFLTSLLVIHGTVGIRLEHQADAYAVETVGREATRRMLEKLADLNMLKRRTAGCGTFFNSTPGSSNAASE